MKNDSLTKLFIDLVKIPSPSGKERDVAMFIKKNLDKKGIFSEFDTAGEVNNSNCGNLITRIIGTKNMPTLLFVAHVDTVESGEKPITPLIQGKMIKSDGMTILGADNKASVACLMEVVEEITVWKVRPTVIVAFTTREEAGRMGASLLTIPEKIDYCFNLDGPNSLGDFVYQTLGEIPFTIKVYGKAAHASVEPEKGNNAIKAAGLLISILPLGKDKRGRTLNIGSIKGGKANNIVPDETILNGQVRAYTQKELDMSLLRIEEKIKRVCNKTGCSYEFITFPDEGAPPATLKKNHSIVTIAKQAARTLGVPFSLSKGSYSSDSNFLSRKYPTLTFSRGSTMPHSYEESVTITELYESKKLILEIIKAAISRK